MTLFFPLIGLVVYSFYLYQTTSDPFFFYTAQPSFGANRSTNLIPLPQVYFRYLKIFFTANFNFQFFIALVEFLFFNLVLLILMADFIKNIKIKLYPQISYQIVNINRLGLNLFSLANLLLPTFTGTLSSLPRYSLFSLSFFIYLAQMKNKGIKILMAFLFFLFHLMLLAFFSQGYFVS